MRHSHLVEHLEAACKLAEADGDPFLAYLIKMAKEAASKRETGKGRNSAIAA
jgi:hypothetical protein